MWQGKRNLPRATRKKRLPIRLGRRRAAPAGVGLVEGPARLFAAGHGGEAQGDGDPVEVVRDDGADGGRVLPAEDGVEDAPDAAAVEVGVAALRH